MVAAAAVQGLSLGPGEQMGVSKVMGYPLYGDFMGFYGDERGIDGDFHGI